MRTDHDYALSEVTIIYIHFHSFATLPPLKCITTTHSTASAAFFPRNAARQPPLTSKDDLTKNNLLLLLSPDMALSENRAPYSIILHPMVCESFAYPSILRYLGACLMYRQAILLNFSCLNHHVW